jgi:hypothetical protein
MGPAFAAKGFAPRPMPRQAGQLPCGRSSSIIHVGSRLLGVGSTYRLRGAKLFGVPEPLAIAAPAPPVILNDPFVTAAERFRALLEEELPWCVKG